MIKLKKIRKKARMPIIVLLAILITTSAFYESANAIYRSAMAEEVGENTPPVKEVFEEEKSSSTEARDDEQENVLEGGVNNQQEADKLEDDRVPEWYEYEVDTDEAEDMENEPELEDKEPDNKSEGDELAEKEPEEDEQSNDRASPSSIEIYTPEELAEFLNNTLGDNDSEFILMNNIDMTGQGFFQGRGGDTPFTGRFTSNEGEVYTISNLSLRGREAYPEIGVFGRDHVGFINTAGDGATIDNVIFDNITYEEQPGNLGGWDTAFSHIGLVIGRLAYGSVNINNVSVYDRNQGAVTMEVGRGTAASNATANIRQTNTRVGGMIGSIAPGATANMRDIVVQGLEIRMMNGRGNTNFAGGLVGESLGTLNIITRYNHVNDVNVNISRRVATEYFVTAGGILGRRTGGNVTIEDTVFSGVIDGNLRVGGYVGNSMDAGTLTLRNVSTTATSILSGRAAGSAGDVGGLVGHGAGNTILENVINRALVRGTYANETNAGGLIGRSGGIVTIHQGRNYGEVQHLAGGIGRIGGFVGRSQNRIEITDSVNRGNLNKSTGNSDDNRVGGLIGQAEHPTAVDNQVITLARVVNFGHAVRDIHTAGGIIGQVSGGDNATSLTHITEATNHGEMRGVRNIGGIIGSITGIRNVIIDGATMNHGLVQGTGSANASGTLAARRGGSSGGIIGDNNGQNTRVFQVGNMGRVRGANRVSEGEGGVGGIIGRQRGAGLLIRETFNAGHISSDTGWRTGGFVGRQQAGGIIEDFYNIGPIVTNTDNRGSGVVGRRTGGSMIIRRGFIAARHTGISVGRQDALRNSAVSSFTFSQVYVVNTMGAFASGTASVNRDRLQAHRNGINVTGADLLTLGILPGISGGPWRVGIGGHEETQSTLPYFAWQAKKAGGAQGELHPLFFNAITPDTLYIQTAGTTNLIMSYAGVVNPATTRIYNVRHTAAWNAANLTSHPIVSGMNGSASIPRFTGTNRLTAGLISPVGVVGFGSVPEKVFMIEVVDGGCPDLSPVGHGIINFPGIMPIQNGDGLLLVGTNQIALSQTFSVSAVGFALVANRVITGEDLDNGKIKIQLERVPISRAIEIVLRDGSSEADPPPALNSVAGSVEQFTTLGEPVPPEAGPQFLPGMGTPRRYTIPADTVKKGDLFQAGYPGFSWKDYSLQVSDISNLTATGTTPFRIYLDLDRVTLRNPTRLRFVSTETEAILPVPEATIYVVNPIGVNSPPPTANGQRIPLTALGGAGVNQFTLSASATLYSEIWLSESFPDYARPGVLDLIDFYDPNEEDEGGAFGIIEIPLEPQTTFPVAFQLNGGNIEGETEDVVQDLLRDQPISLENVPEPVRDQGYILTGWLKNGEGELLSQEEVARLMVQEEMFFVAWWELGPGVFQTISFLKADQGFYQWLNPGGESAGRMIRNHDSLTRETVYGQDYQAWEFVYNNYLLAGAQFSLFQWNNKDSPPPKGQMIRTENIGSGLDQWTLVWEGSSSNAPENAMDIEIDSRNTYFQLVETKAPSGYELPFIQWRLITGYDVDLMNPSYQNMGWEAIGYNRFLRIEEVGTGGQEVSIIRSPDGIWIIGNNTNAMLPFAGGSGNLFLIMISFVAFMIGVGLLGLDALRKRKQQRVKSTLVIRGPMKANDEKKVVPS